MSRSCLAVGEPLCVQAVVLAEPEQLGVEDFRAVRQQPVPPQEGHLLPLKNQPSSPDPEVAAREHCSWLWSSRSFFCLIHMRVGLTTW